MIRVLLIIVSALGACASFPQLDTQATEAARMAKFPQLQPLNGIYADPGATAATQAEADRLSARAAALKARAARLRGPVVDAETKAQLSQGVSQ